VLLLHGILAADAVEPPKNGLRGWPLREIRVGGLAVWATLCLEERFSPGRAELLTQHALLEHAVGACLPVRFPTCLPDELAVRELLEGRRDELLSALEHVRGRAELAVTMTWTGQAPTTTEAPIETTTPGRRFLEERRRRHVQADKRRAEAERLAGLLEADPGVVDARHTLCPSDQIALSSALLVGREHASAVRKRVEDLRQGIRILVNGPWPPYSFASLEGQPRSSKMS
jgi:hypothetical protein